MITGYANQRGFVGLETPGEFRTTGAKQLSPRHPEINSKVVDGGMEKGSVLSVCITGTETAHDGRRCTPDERDERTEAGCASRSIA